MKNIRQLLRVLLLSIICIYYEASFIDLELTVMLDLRSAPSYEFVEAMRDVRSLQIFIDAGNYHISFHKYDWTVSSV